MNQSRFDWIVISILGCMGAILFVIIGWLLYNEIFPQNPANFNSSNIVITTPKVRVGGELIFTLSMEKFGVYPASIASSLISEDRTLVYALAPEAGALPPGKYNLSMEIDIPKRVNPGRYSLARIYLYAVGRQTVVRQYETPLFEVIAPDKDDKK